MRGFFAVVVGVVLSVLTPAESEAQFSSAPIAPNDPRIACATSFFAVSTNEPSAVVVRLFDITQPFDGTIKAYGADRVWSAHVSTAARVVRTFATPLGGSLARPEYSVLVRAEGPIEAVEFDPSWSSCAFRAGVRAPNAADPADVARPTVVASDSAPIEPVACATPYVSPSVLRAQPPSPPPMAVQQGISGVVLVQVALDERGGATLARIWSSPSAILNYAAIYAARMSTYRGAIFRCRPVPSGYEFPVDFLQT